MSDLWRDYRSGMAHLPASNLVWPFFGAGLESVGVNGQPLTEPLPACGPEEILVRVDALGLCASDAKMIRMGPDYPLFFNRDFAADPARLGHEAALTVVAVGEAWQAQYYPGQRLGIQPDVYVDGKRAIFGVNLHGAMAQYVTLDRRVLASDKGSCVFPVIADAGYADTAVLEPWACIDVAYSLTARRLSPKQGGLLWIQGHVDDTRPYSLNHPLESTRIVLSDVPEEFVEQLRKRHANVTMRDGATAAAIVSEFSSEKGIDDIILLDPPTAQTVREAVANLADHGTLNLVIDHALDAAVAVDMSKLHYQHLALLGCTGPEIAAAYGQTRNRAELRPGGVACIVGAGGTMGRMHIQRALEMPNGPDTIIATNRGEARLNRLIEDFAEQAAANGRELVAFSPRLEPARMQAEVDRLTAGRGVDDAIVIVPNPAVVDDVLPYLAPDGLLSIFAGVQAGNLIDLPLDHAALYGAQFTGTSGSTVADQLRVLEKVQDRTLSAGQCVAAIGGMQAMRDGLQAVLEQTYAGKVVIFPQLRNLPLMSLAELEGVLPDVYARLAPGPAWTAAAERTLIEAFWQRAEEEIG